MPVTSKYNPVISVLAILCALTVLFFCEQGHADKTEDDKVVPPVYTMTQLNAMLDRIRNPFEMRLPARPKAIEAAPVVVVPPAPVLAPTPRPEPSRPTPPVIVRQPVEPPKIPQHAPAPAPHLPDFKLSGIIWNSDRPQAIVNGQVVDVGDVIGGAQVQQINKTGLSVLFHEKTFTINLY